MLNFYSASILALLLLLQVLVPTKPISLPSLETNLAQVWRKESFRISKKVISWRKVGEKIKFWRKLEARLFKLDACTLVCRLRSIKCCYFLS